MRRLVPVVLGTAVVLAGLGVILVVSNGKDSSEVDVPAAQGGPGELEPDLGREHQDLATRELRLSGRPPTSGPHPAVDVTQEGEIDDRAIIHALELGNVVLVYHGSDAPPEFKSIQAQVAGGPFDPEVAAAGQMVILVSRPRTSGFQALAWRRRLESVDPADPALREFAEAWLGRGAP